MTIGGTLGSHIGRFLSGLEAGAVFLAVFLVFYLPGRLVVVPILKTIGNRIDVDETFWQPFVKIVHAGFVVSGFSLAIPASGLAGTPETVGAITAGATIALGFAARDVLGNLVSGVFIVTDPRFHIGDWIQWDDQEGIIEDISFRVTRVHTFDNELITVPNSELTSNVVVNPVAKDRRRITYEFAIGYEDDIDRARSILIGEADRHEEILDRPRARAIVTELADSYVALTATFWIEQPARIELLRIRSEFIQAVKERFDAADIEMPYPYRELTGEIGTRALPERDPTVPSDTHRGDRSSGEGKG